MTSVVVTSIAAPNRILREIARGCVDRGSRFYVIGDSKSPLEFHIAGCSFFSVEQQIATGLKTATLCPTRHYARKNVGYLLAMLDGAELIVETDDDNLPLDAFWGPRDRRHRAAVSESAGWVNVYRYFTQANIWPRGLPLDAVQQSVPNLEDLPVADADCPIQQGLADDNPDVDAIYRLVLPLPVKFEAGRRVALGRGTWCPFNSQNTTWWRFENNTEELVTAIRSAVARSGEKLLVIVCPPSPQYDNDTRHKNAQERMSAAVVDLPSVSLITPDRYENWYHVGSTYDERSEQLGHVPYSAAGFAGLGTLIARRIDAWLRPPYKVIALDLDNTLWRGVLGEDGVEGIVIGDEHAALQRSMAAQTQAGMLVTLCSKNNEADVEEAFRVRRDMVLRPDHIVASRINWLPKSSNLRELAAELSLGLDSFVFLDDSPTEIAEVRENAPEALGVQIPERAEDIPSFLEHLWVLDHWTVTADDKNRTAVYQQNRERSRVLTQATNLADFIAGLQLQVKIAPMTAEQLPRVSQLTQRTNQFNCTTIRRSEAEIESLLQSGGECLTVDAADRFGAYGLIGAVIYTSSADALEVDTFLLSCRALGRGIEHRVIQQLGTIARERGLAIVRIPFRATAKNAPARLFLDNVGGDYRKGDADAFALELPAEYAATVSYRPSDAPAIIAEDAGKKSAPRVATKRADYQRIATELRRPAAVLEELRKAGSPAVGKRVGSDFAYTGYESVVARIWADVLGYEQVGRDVNFFEAGGDSLRGVEVISRTIRELANESLTMSTLLEAPVLKEYARLLDKGGSREYRCIVPMRKGAGRPPFFCVHGAGGNVLSLRNLAMLMPDDLPFYALQARGLDGSEPFATVEDTAAHYIGEIRRMQPEGPYYIGGGCYGGLVAFEMARQLVASGEQVGLLAMIDTYNHAYGSLLPRHKVMYCQLRFIAQRSAHHLRQLSTLSGEERSSYLTEKVQGLGRRVATAAALVSGKKHSEQMTSGPEGLPDDSEENQFHHILHRVLNANVRAQDNYIPKPYPGSILLFRAAERAVEPYQDRYLGWGPLAAGGIEDYEIQSNHTYIADHPDLAKKLDECLRREEARYGRRPVVAHASMGEAAAR